MLGNFSVVLHDLQWSEEALALAEDAARSCRKPRTTLSTRGPWAARR